MTVKVTTVYRVSCDEHPIGRFSPRDRASRAEAEFDRKVHEQEHESGQAFLKYGKREKTQQ